MTLPDQQIPHLGGEPDCNGLAEDDLRFIREIKQDFFDLMAKIEKHTNLLESDFDDHVVGAEETIDDMVWKAWVDASERAGLSEHRTLPVTQQTLAWREKMTKKEISKSLSF